eukprot:TRINITY_DN26255_c0_g1_i1.p1 TRINITY_DN26255_c0_g1~~TRINITY_DN26255_c0_g1_i1.p1  ORF type:complete len:171 (+),score=24.70 TRINITY_DN26255_c0_g1_i1:63-575(+)
MSRCQVETTSSRTLSQGPGGTAKLPSNGEQRADLETATEALQGTSTAAGTSQQIEQFLTLDNLPDLSIDLANSRTCVHVGAFVTCGSLPAVPTTHSFRGSFESDMDRSSIGSLPQCSEDVENFQDLNPLSSTLDSDGVVFESRVMHSWRRRLDKLRERQQLGEAEGSSQC